MPLLRSGPTRTNYIATTPRSLVPAVDLDTAERLIGKLVQALAPLETLGHRLHSLTTLSAAHAKALEMLANDGKTIAAYASTDGQQLRRAFETIVQSAGIANVGVGGQRLP
jgi:hypothetical protein